MPDSSSDVFSELDCVPPSKSNPAGLCQDTCPYRPSAWSSWDCSHFPSLKAEQYFGVSCPPHTVSPDCVCRYRPENGRGGSEHRWPSGRITSAECWSSSSRPTPPVTNRAAKCNYLEGVFNFSYKHYLVGLESHHYSYCQWLP